MHLWDMMNLGYFGNAAAILPFGSWFYPVLFIVITWSAIWKGIALWKCGRNNQLIWFVVLLVVNTLGILEIIYLLFFQKGKKTRKK